MRKFDVVRPAELLQFLFKEMADTKKTRVRQLLKFNAVLVNGRPVTRFDYSLRPGDRVEVSSVKTETVRPPRFGIWVIHEDPDIIVVDKPYGLLTIATPKIVHRDALFAVNAYINENQDRRQMRKGKAFGKEIFLVHRLDRDASGVLIFARNYETKIRLQEDWADFQKKYYAIVEGVPGRPFGEIQSYLKENKALRVSSGPNRPGAKLSVTHYKIVRTMGDYALLEISLETGRKHQIRVHCADIGHPIAGDPDYGSQSDPFGRLALHAYQLTINHPVSGEKMTFESPLPGSLDSGMLAGA